MTREEAIYRLKNMAWLYGSAEREQNIEAIGMAIEALQTIDNCDQCEWCCPSDGIPTIHAVRCKDCRWYDNRYGDVCHNPRYGDGWANYPPPYVDEDYWCKDGERKGGDSE